jgi:UDP-N-acetylmuramate dehydrogenase
MSARLDALPDVRGTLRRQVPLAPLTWLRVGGPAEFVFQPADADDLAAFLAAVPAGMPVLPMGVASNLRR